MRLRAHLGDGTIRTSETTGLIWCLRWCQWCSEHAGQIYEGFLSALQWADYNTLLTCAITFEEASKQLMVLQVKTPLTQFLTRITSTTLKGKFLFSAPCVRFAVWVLEWSFINQHRFIKTFTSYFNHDILFLSNSKLNLLEQSNVLLCVFIFQLCFLRSFWKSEKLYYMW